MNIATVTKPITRQPSPIVININNNAPAPRIRRRVASRPTQATSRRPRVNSPAAKANITRSFAVKPAQPKVSKPVAKAASTPTKPTQPAANPLQAKTRTTRTMFRRNSAANNARRGNGLRQRGLRARLRSRFKR